MSEASIPVDLFNPGQVFACLGLIEAADILLGGAAGGFQWDTGERDLFVLSANGTDNPVEAVLAFLAEAEAVAVVPHGGALSTEKWGVRSIPSERDVFPCPRPDTPSALPCRLVAGERSIFVSHWVDRSSAGIDNVKFWAGMAGYPGPALVRDLLAQVRTWSANQRAAAGADPFGNLDPSSASAVQSSNLRFDYRAGTIPFDAGFSTNAHSDVAMIGFPLVDLLAAIGLEHARPHRIDKLTYRYAVWRDLLTPPLARAALGTAGLGFTTRTFRIDLGWPGQENQARAIKLAREDTAS
ncbi:type I-G CRISPR-associated protein Cas8g2 [Blastochloris sulfoviridis]|uniref:Type I-U CRISPR-associated protein Cas8c n=1 Tax=Blastochloris sulfoviridis TaxID=50712 RepID=A0A5M6HML9_9HYPH|nr:type I-U CRISPR-associated protein Cas8c [Blastochloris sulfoviridis]KAA5597134.1 type I-U CRISPR-associated protein Cas8c [Blastochloris sulfoviridis]